MEIEDIRLTPEEIVFEMNCSKGIVDTYDGNIIHVCKDVANAATDKAIKAICRYMVSDGYLSTVNGKHGVHVTDEMYSALKKLVGE